MKKPVLWVIPFLCLGCGGSVTESATRTDALAGATNGKSTWVLTSFAFGPGEFVLPLDCISETLQFVGTLWFNDHFVYSNGRLGTHDNWDIWYEPGEYESLTYPGQKWLFGTGFNNHGIWWLDESGNMVASANHEFTPLVNDTTGQRIRLALEVHVVVNALGEYKVYSISHTCSLIPG